MTLERFITIAEEFGQKVSKRFTVFYTEASSLIPIRLESIQSWNPPKQETCYWQAGTKRQQLNNSLFKFYMGEYISTREPIRDHATNGRHFFSRIIISKGVVCVQNFSNQARLWWSGQGEEMSSAIIWNGFPGSATPIDKHPLGWEMASYTIFFTKFKSAMTMKINNKIVKLQAILQKFCLRSFPGWKWSPAWKHILLLYDLAWGWSLETTGNSNGECIN